MSAVIRLERNAAAEIWRVSDEVRWRLWDGEAVAYNGRTGDTHHFADFAAWVFGRLCIAPASCRSLARDAEDSVELRAGGAVGETITRTLALLQRLQIVEAVA
ncbi:MAG TPA: HPr-rel-A system PqqD family peptide chaperone [Stellaceae bacterium]|nr:HPr-rel-A system PqqD family peptide chaperone [Stellaceae bacterium]